jgi:hypothetical protein
VVHHLEAHPLEVLLPRELLGVPLVQLVLPGVLHHRVPPVAPVVHHLVRWAVRQQEDPPLEGREVPPAEVRLPEVPPAELLLELDPRPEPHQGVARPGQAQEDRPEAVHPEAHQECHQAHQVGGPQAHRVEGPQREDLCLLQEALLRVWDHLPAEAHPVEAPLPPI